MRRSSEPLIEINWHDFGASVRAAMKREGLSCRTASRRTNIEFSRIAKVCRGQPCKTEIYLTLCRCFGLDPFQPASVRRTHASISSSVTADAVQRV